MKQKGFAPILILLIIVAIGMMGYFSYKTYISSKIDTSGSSGVIVDPVFDISAWKTVNFSKTISFKLPPEISEPKYVNQGQYAVETVLPNNTTLQIWGADGASPSGGKDYYDDLKQAMTNSHYLAIKNTTFNDKEAIEFTGGSLDTRSGLVFGGENTIYVKGLMIKMSDNRALMIIHYQSKTLQDDVNFNEDQIVTGEILSTFKFTDPNQTKACGGIAGLVCPSGFECKISANYPDAMGSCEQSLKGAGY